MRILFLGDLVGKPARRAVAQYLLENKAREGIDAVIANSDNLAHGRGVTRSTAEEMLASGVDILTCGDHAWDSSQAFAMLTAGDLAFVAPSNLPEKDFRLGCKAFTVGDVRILVINLLGQVFIPRDATSPFEAAEQLLQENAAGEKIPLIFVDFHAEATSEKKALGRFLKGRVSAVIGTHTHVQTADEEILPGGTAYLSDAGMGGVEDSVLGCTEEAVLAQYLHNTGFKYKLAESNRVRLEGALLEVDAKTGKASKIERFSRRVNLPQ